MKDDFNNDNNTKGRINKPLQEITDKDLEQKVKTYAALAPNHKERFQVLRFHQNYVSLKHSREKNQIERGYWFTEGQRRGLNQGKTLEDEQSNKDKLLAHSRKITLNNIEGFYHQNYSTSKNFNKEAGIKPAKETVQEKRSEKEKSIEVYHPNGELDEKNLKAFVNNVIKRAPNKELKEAARNAYSSTLNNKDAQKNLNQSIENWVQISSAHGLYANPEIDKGSTVIQKGLEDNNKMQEGLRKKTKEVVKDFYHQNYSLSKSFNEHSGGDNKPKQRDRDMDKD